MEDYKSNKNCDLNYYALRFIQRHAMYSSTSWFLLIVICLFFPKVENFRWSRRYYPSKSFTRRYYASRSTFESRIGGRDLSITVVPYQVSLQTNGEHFCGGAVITSAHVITAAHCTTDMTASDLKIRAGSSYHKKGGITVDIKEIIQHPLYFEARVVDYDMSILVLARFIPFSKFIKPIPVAKKNDTWCSDTSVLISGWGHVKELDIGSETLQGVFLEVLDRDVCQEFYGKFTNRMLCVGYLEGGSDSCQGDSGGPAVIDGVLVGLASFGQECARPNTPGVYTNVAAFSEFIAEVVSRFHN